MLPTSANMSSNKEIKKPKQSKLKQLLKSPGKILSKATDLYVRSMVICDGQMGSYGGAMGCATILPRSFSAGSVGSSSHGRWVRDGDYGELLRAASGRRVEELEGSKGKPVVKPAGGTMTMKMMMKPRRSCSVGVGRIDEDEVCEFGEEVMVVRTRSLADPRRRRGGGSAH